MRLGPVPVTGLAYRLWSHPGPLALVAAVVLVFALAGGFLAGSLTRDAPEAGAQTGDGGAAGEDGAGGGAVTPADPAPAAPGLAGEAVLVVHGSDRVTLYVEGHGVLSLLLTDAAADGGGVRIGGTARYHLEEGGYEPRPFQFTLGGVPADTGGADLPVLTAAAPVAAFGLSFPGASLPAVLEVSAPEVATGDIDEAMLCVTADGGVGTDVLSC
ncbi:hypothetical protein ACIBFB_19470 [Nocardiopsis sp. NPDC050513]|uniref:hypothetical protein n=1 Tax=Nocardiopsis sp. NPDC050513 TaxID=3364338 RepID=UPI0037A31B50